MIPHAITSTGSYVDLWSQLKAIQHALIRVNHGAAALTELDRELLLRLAEMIRGAVPEDKVPIGELNQYIEALASHEGDPALDFDLRHYLKEELEPWLPAQKVGIDKKIQRLLAALQKYQQESAQRLIAARLPDEESKILRSIVARLLVQVESSLHA